MNLLQILVAELKEMQLIDCVISFKWASNMDDICWVYFDHWVGCLQQRGAVIVIQDVLHNIQSKWDMSDPAVSVDDIWSALWRCARTLRQGVE